MHGRPRKPSGDDGAAKQKDLVKANNLQSLQSQFFRNHHDKLYSKEALAISANLVEINPEIYTVWNYRKIAMKKMMEAETDKAKIKEILEEELRVVERALKRNYKSYDAWHHRKWVTNMGYSSLDHEFLLLDQLLKADSRNFHGWNYRRFVAEVKNVPDEEELKFTTKKINENFSNYSAWHNRSALLSRLLNNKSEGICAKEQLTEEYELVQQALFTDSDDQSGWLYHLWLLGQTVAPKGPRLVATWPSHGSQLAIDFHEQSHVNVTFNSPFGTDHCIFSEGIPLIIHFSEPVRGVNSSTIKINSVLFESDPLLWRPLCTYGLQAKTWVTMLRLQPNFRTDETFTVQVVVANTPEIISSKGYSLASSTEVNFSMYIQLGTSVSIIGKLETDEVNWEGERFTPVNVGEGEFPMQIQLGCSSPDHNLYTVENVNWQHETLEREIKACRELLEIEMDSKWAKLTLARLLMAKERITSGSMKGNKTLLKDEIFQLFNDLIDIDPSHSDYYKDQLSLILLGQVTGSKEKLQEHCRVSSSAGASSNRQHKILLQLNNLSLSRIGCMERLLWVQNLDLSHNGLRSIEELEALQLLTCLNLSYNLLASFTALGPLRLIKTLRALNISYNEIGLHSVDTTRYSFPSPLSNSSMESNEDMDQNNLECSWEIAFTFKGLHLRQLDAAGNPAIDENCRTCLIKMLPTLKWLDGTNIN